MRTYARVIPQTLFYSNVQVEIKPLSDLENVQKAKNEFFKVTLSYLILVISVLPPPCQQQHCTQYLTTEAEADCLATTQMAFSMDINSPTTGLDHT